MASSRPAGDAHPDGSIGDGLIGIVVLTHGRVHLLRQCVENVLSVTSQATTEIVIWNNASTDGTRAYLDSVADARVRVVHHESNIGQNAYAPAFGMLATEFLIELDDDVVGAPANWDETMRDALHRLPDVGFLAADLEDDPHDVTAQWRYTHRPHEYTPYEVNGVRLLTGPAGGTCAITSKDIYTRAGGFRQDPKWAFWQEEPAYIEDIARLGYSSAVLADLRVHHTGGPYYCETPPEKELFWQSYWRMRARRVAVKRLVFRVPFFRRLNTRFRWFEAPS